jgi:hypothetical protein
MRILLAAGALAFALAGCQTAPKLPALSLQPGDKVGVLVVAPDSPVHSHIGTTIFNNFDKTYPYQWTLRKDVQAAVADAVAQAGFVAVDLAAAGLRYEDVDGLVAAADGSWRIAAGREEAVQRLAGTLGLRAVVTLKAQATVVLMQCAGGPCSFFAASNPGLFTRSFLGMTNYIAAPAFAWHVYVFSPPADVASSDALAGRLKMPAVRLHDYSPADFSNLTEADFVPVHDAIVHFAHDVAASAATSLRGQ